MSPRVSVGVSLKMYFGHADARRWFERVAELADAQPAVADGRVECFVIPTYLQVLPAIAAFAGTRVVVGAQDVATEDSGAFTGEVSAAELAEVGVRVAEVGHAERRRLFGETEQVVAAKTAAALRNGGAVVLDTRRDDERAAGGVRGSLHVPVHELAARLDEIPDGEVWVYCGSGYRASVAASVLARTGRRPVVVDGGYDDEDTGSRAHGLHADQP